MTGMAQPRPEDALAYLDNYNADGTKKSNGGKPSLKGKGLLVLIGLVGFVSLLVILIARLMFSTPSLQTDLISLSAQQQDIQRWAVTATKSARSDTILNGAASINQVMTTDNKTLNNYIVQQYKVKDVGKLVKAKADNKVDAKLKSASDGNRFDEEFRNSVGAKITSYKQSLREVNSKAEGKALKTYLSDAFNHIDSVKLQ